MKESTTDLSAFPSPEQVAPYEKLLSSQEAVSAGTENTELFIMNNLLEAAENKVCVLEALQEAIQGALNTEETGQALVEVARAAHAAELELVSKHTETPAVGVPAGVASEMPRTDAEFVRMDMEDLSSGHKVREAKGFARTLEREITICESTMAEYANTAEELREELTTANARVKELEEDRERLRRCGRDENSNLLASRGREMALREALESVWVRVCEMNRDSRNGDYTLPELARLDLGSILDQAPKVDAALTTPAPPVIPRAVADEWQKLAEYGWTIIANAGGGDWEKESFDWQTAAAKYSDEYHAALTKYREATSSYSDDCAFILEPPSQEIKTVCLYCPKCGSFDWEEAQKLIKKYESQ